MLTVYNPYDGSVIESLPRTTEREAFDALEAAHELFLDRAAWLRPHQRMAILERAAAIIDERAEDLAVAAAREGGKPLADSRVEIARAREGMRIAARELASLGGGEVPMGLTPASDGRLAMTVREPRGVVMAIAAFNHPFNLIVHQVAPAFASGCPVLVKPASATPLSCRNLLDILHEAGMPRGWARMVLCENTVTEKLVADPRVAFLTFIGSSAVGWRLRSMLPPGAGCALEHGGAAPVIMEADADLSLAMPGLTKGGFYHAGQVCVSVQRIFAHAIIARDVAERLAESAQALVVGDPLDACTDVGPLISPREVERVHEWVERAQAQGGKVLCGGGKISDTMYMPTVLFNPPDDALISTREIFGPVVAVYPFSTMDEALRRANQTAYSFQAAVYTRDIDTALYAATRLNATTVMINDHTAFRVDWMPFGGARDSGQGVGGIGYSMREMTLEKLLVIKSGAL
ncbi:MAG: aldehyde dehydrogenase family protein [Desulfovibrionaceae bacterium]